MAVAIPRRRVMRWRGRDSYTDVLDGVRLKKEGDWMGTRNAMNVQRSGGLELVSRNEE